MRIARAALFALVFTTAITAATSRGAAPLQLARIFGNGVVLQRDARLPVWGAGAPGSSVSLSMAGQKVRATVDATGAWRGEFSPFAAGGPYKLIVSAGNDSIVIDDVLVGDVWLASGQSNMEWRLQDADGGAQAAANAHDDKLREFKVPTSWSWTAERELAGGAWASADAQHAGRFSAVAYFFARELRQSVGVPIGIVNSTWGGSAIAPWISRAALGLDDAAWQSTRAAEARYQEGLHDGLRAKLGAVLPSVDSGLVGERALWADAAFDDSKWSALRVPGAWERLGYAGLDGVGWYRTSFTLTNADLKKRVRLGVGAIDDADVTYVNGSEAGRTAAYGVKRVYSVPATALRAGRNVLTVRVTDGGGDGGIIGNAGDLYVEVDGERRPLPSQWQFKVAVVSLGEDGQHVNKIPAVLYHRMVHPLLPFPIKGVIWYQGESNANNDQQATAYRKEFATLIESWRREWGSEGSRKDFPFLWVQLPNFGTPETLPPKSGGWAILRESQEAALTLPATGQAVTIDIGDPADIHPRNKLDVGRRLALVARKIAYGQNVVSSGPTYRSHRIVGNRIDVQFDNIGGGLLARGDSLKGFAIAGDDGKYVWADARIEGQGVQVSSRAVPEPKSVRYAWGNSPPRATLYNREGLPAAPFRTDER